MHNKVTIDGLEEPVYFKRRKGTKNLRISIKGDGKVTVTVPYGIPEFAARSFVRSKIDWIKKNQKPKLIIENRSHIGKSHRLIIKPSYASRHSTKVTETEILVNLPVEIEQTSSKGQKIIKKACDKALLYEAETLLPQRLKQMGQKTGIVYNSCRIKKLKSRWGSCDSDKNITLNTYLIQLDWKLIDYVIFHELAHTHYPHHQNDFWNFVNKLCPDYIDLRKELKEMPTSIMPTIF